ncbi:hypothetical protein OHA10_32655 [Kribbella sp. NBC_00662]|jgi:hypothetical protein|uniref:hypothetical protein n=1 Tax=Kribbella sp. NBC_00662 TaxID=2975969 RepID=UPI003243CFDE
MTISLQLTIDSWEAQLDRIAEISASNDWFLEEQRLAEALHTIAVYREHILPVLSDRDPRLAAQMTVLIDRLEVLRDDLYRTVHPPNSYEEVAQTIITLRSLAQVAARAERALEDAR